MIKLSEKIEKTFAKAALASAARNVNSTCRFYVYQEVVPECARQLSKGKLNKEK